MMFAPCNGDRWIHAIDLFVMQVLFYLLLTFLLNMHFVIHFTFDLNIPLHSKWWKHYKLWIVWMLVLVQVHLDVSWKSLCSSHETYHQFLIFMWQANHNSLFQLKMRNNILMCNCKLWKILYSSSLTKVSLMPLHQ